MGFNPDNYDLKKLSEYPLIAFGNDLPDAAFVPVVSTDEQDALANYKISLAQIRDFIIQNGDYTNVIDYRPENYAIISGKQLTIPAGWRLECPNGFLPTGEYQNAIVEITEDRTIEFSQQPVGKWVVFITESDNYLCLKSSLLVRKTRDKVINPIEGTICIETDTNLWYRWTGSNWQQLTGMPLLNVDVGADSISVSLCASLMRNRLNFEYLLAQAGFEIPESRGPFERIITNVKKSGAELLYYAPAHTEVDLTNYPDTLDLISSAYQRAIATEMLVQYTDPNKPDFAFSYYRDPATGLDFAVDLATYSKYYDLYGLAPFIYFDGTNTIWTPKTTHGDLICDIKQGNRHTQVWADGYSVQTMSGVEMALAVYTFYFIGEFIDTNYNVATAIQDILDTAAMGVKINSLTTTSIQARNTYQQGPRAGYIRVAGFLTEASLNQFIGADSHHEYYLLGNAATNIPADLAGQLATILNNYNQIVGAQANYFSIKADDDADALQKSIENPNKFVYTADE